MTAPSTLDGIKRTAKRLKKQSTTGMTHAQALDQSARQSGYTSYHHAQKSLSAGTPLTPPAPARSLAHLKKVAGGLRKEAREANQTLKRCDALDLVARKYGYDSYEHARLSLPETDPAPAPRT